VHPSMALYRLAVQSVSRSTGRTAVHAAAYRAGGLGAPMLCPRDGVTVVDYRRKGGVEAVFILTPVGCDWAQDRETLWTAAERAEKRKDAKTAREYVVAIPDELRGDPAARRDLVEGFAAELGDRYGIAVDAAIHRPGRDGDDRNWHAHLLTTTRVVGPEGLGAKTRLLDVSGTASVEVEALRASWARRVNAALERAGSTERVTNLSHARRGTGLLPTLHLGPSATGMERRGEPTHVGDHNRAVTAHNAALAHARADLARTEAELYRAECREASERRLARGRQVLGLGRRPERAQVAASAAVPVRSAAPAILQSAMEAAAREAWTGPCDDQAAELRWYARTEPYASPVNIILLRLTKAGLPFERSRDGSEVVLRVAFSALGSLLEGMSYDDRTHLLDEIGMAGRISTRTVDQTKAEAARGRQASEDEERAQRAAAEAARLEAIDRSRREAAARAEKNGRAEAERLRAQAQREKDSYNRRLEMQARREHEELIARNPMLRRALAEHAQATPAQASVAPAAQARPASASDPARSSAGAARARPPQPSPTLGQATSRSLPYAGQGAAPPSGQDSRSAPPPPAGLPPPGRLPPAPATPRNPILPAGTGVTSPHAQPSSWTTSPSAPLRAPPRPALDLAALARRGVEESRAPVRPSGPSTDAGPARGSEAPAPIPPPPASIVLAEAERRLRAGDVIRVNEKGDAVVLFASREEISGIGSEDTDGGGLFGLWPALKELGLAAGAPDVKGDGTIRPYKGPIGRIEIRLEAMIAALARLVPAAAEEWFSRLRRATATSDRNKAVADRAGSPGSLGGSKEGPGASPGSSVRAPPSARPSTGGRPSRNRGGGPEI